MRPLAQSFDALKLSPAVAMVDAAYAQLFREQGKRPPPGHPIFKIA